MERDRSHEDEARHPMHGHPTELNAEDREKRRAEQRENASRAQPVKQPIGKGVPDDSTGGRSAAGIGA